MRRRSFLKLSGAATLSTLLGVPSSPIASYGKPTNEGVFLDEGILEDRNQNRSTVVCRSGMVCTSQPLASLAGLELLRAGGNAVDAAVCANAMLSVVEPMMCGPGGDLFAIVWIEKERKLYGLNASGRAPYNWSLKDAQALGLKSIPEYSPLAWSVPGCVSGWEALLKRFGKRSLLEVLGPAIECARAGFAVSPVIARGWPAEVKEFPSWAKAFAPGGQAPRYGEVFRNPDIAGFFEILAREGAQAFYEGEIAERIMKFSTEHDGRFSLRDFREHEATWVEPVSSSYRGYDVWELPPNGQGIAALQILNLLETFDIGALGPNSAEHLHLLIEAKKLAFEDRAVYYADTDFVDVPVKELISKAYARERAKLIDPKRAAQRTKAGLPENTSDTTYLTAADEEGNMVSLIQSIYYRWGSRFVPDGLGFCLQNRGQLFSLNSEDRNRLEPHKRPFHTIIPAFVTEEGRPVISFGVMGGSFQPQGHAQVLMNLIDFGMSVQQAGEQPRVRHYGGSSPTGERSTDGGTVGLERGIPDSVREQLAAMGHRIQRGVSVFGGYQGIWREESPRRYFGGSDPRKDGCAVGY